MVAAVTTLVVTPDIDELVRDLRRLYYGTGLEMMIRVGSLIVDRLFEGDAARWQSRGRKDISFRKLAKHPQLPFQASTLSRAAGIYLLAKRFPGVTKLERLGPSHLQEVLSLTHPEQDRLLQMANAAGWSTRRLREEVRTRPSSGGRRGASYVPSFQKCLLQWRERIEGRALMTGLESVDCLDIDETRELLAVVRGLCQQSEALARMLSTRLAEAERRSSTKVLLGAKEARARAAASRRAAGALAHEPTPYALQPPARRPIGSRETHV